MRVRDWMTRNPITVQARDPVRQAATLLASRRVNQLPVLAGDRLVGIITERDIREAVFCLLPEWNYEHRETSVLDLRVEAVMTPHVLVVQAQDDLVRAARLMRRERLNALPVMDRHRLVGILTGSDLAVALISLLSAERQAGGEGLRDGGFGARHDSRGEASLEGASSAGYAEEAGCTGLGRGAS